MSLIHYDYMSNYLSSNPHSLSMKTILMTKLHQNILLPSYTVTSRMVQQLVPYSINDIPSIDLVCGVLGPVKRRERLEQDSREQKERMLDDTKNEIRRWMADEDEVLLQAWEKYRAQGWEVIAANVE